jgi:aconitate decarboxylase
MHLESIVLPALFVAAEHITNIDSANKTLGTDFLPAWIVGCEVGPRVGLALYGGQILTSGWHSDAIFGPSASSAAVSKLLKLPANLIEDAVGIACSQACGLMSAQYESEVKRMQHGSSLHAMVSSQPYLRLAGTWESRRSTSESTVSSGDVRERIRQVASISG